MTYETPRSKRTFNEEITRAIFDHSRSFNQNYGTDLSTHVAYSFVPSARWAILFKEELGQEESELLPRRSYTKPAEPEQGYCVRQMSPLTTRNKFFTSERTAK
jgi:hypothetical protein